MKRFGLIICLLIGLGLCGQAQELYVSCFETLPADESASHSRVKDNEGKLAALIKVITTDMSYSFDGGFIDVIEVQEKDNEIWLFVPSEMKRISIQHPQFGTLKNYYYPESLEAGVTYKMVIDYGVKPIVKPEPKPEVKPEPKPEPKPEVKPEPKPEPKPEVKPEPKPEPKPEVKPEPKPEPKPEVKPDPKPNEIEKDGPTTTTEGTSRTKYAKRTFVLVNGSMSIAPQFSAGITIGQVKSFGWYVSAMTNGSFGQEFIGECDENGFVGEDYPYYIGKTKKERLSITAGGVCRIAKNTAIYAGLGYGKRNVYYEVEDGTYFKNQSVAHNGISIEAGLMQQFGKFMFSGGVTTIGFGYAEFKVGIGVAF